MDGKLKYLVGIVAIIVIGIGAFVVMKPRPAPQNIVAPATPEAAKPADTAAPPTETASDCLMPGPAPAIPRGVTSSADDMKLGRVTIQAFVNELEAFQKCREQEIASAATTVTEAQKQAWRDSGNQAIDAANLLASAFAAQLKIFKAKQANAAPADVSAPASVAQ